MTTKYLPEVVYTIALTSLSTHMLWQRKDAADARAHYDARLRLLADTAARLRAGADVAPADFATLDTLAREPGAGRAAARGTETRGAIGWREVLLGRPRADAAQAEHWDAQDWEELKREAEEAA